jgi:hypothetical protein
MLETCPRGEEKTNLFACIFLQHLPREIRVLLARETTRTRRSWQSRRMSCGRCTTPTVAAASTLCNRTVWKETSLPPCGRATGSEAAAAPEGAATAADEEAEAVDAPLRQLRSRRPPRRPGWLQVSASSIGDMVSWPLPAPPPAAGRETAEPGATKCGRPRRTSPPHRRHLWSSISCGHWGLIQYLSSFVGGGAHGTALEESRRPGYIMLGVEAVGNLFCGPKICLDISPSKG